MKRPRAERCLRHLTPVGYSQSWGGGTSWDLLVEQAVWIELVSAGFSLFLAKIQGKRTKSPAEQRSWPTDLPRYQALRVFVPCSKEQGKQFENRESNKLFQEL
jgi:hypothetical protein